MGRFQALYDGIVTGLDPIGTAIGYKNNNTYFIGYTADKYSLNGTQSNLYQFRPLFDGAKIDYKEPKSIERTITEQLFKGVGDSMGIAANIILFGLPQATFLLQTAGKHYQKWKIENYVAPLANRIFPIIATKTLK